MPVDADGSPRALAIPDAGHIQPDAWENPLSVYASRFFLLSKENPDFEQLCSFFLINQ
ncbi:hypothetical protein ALP86_103222 [Pseudomonas amygdali pv. mori]|uniref:Uncharacterized protein n=1 Tax=Pseudomonas amygdali pv. mori TaxID=34065 RepID=A0A3M4KWF5_PSEA0|nr:hypothetical protein ALQ05_102463 [Pseudomonas amygdali pv. mori]RMR40580.1 hypothetical protein ALP86_103222 [Pseudomonas amygdali pv. mori]RMT18035.1 hypothetical protein ALP52_103107 [Pseudomonas amygdali pv. mori]